MPLFPVLDLASTRRFYAELLEGTFLVRDPSGNALEFKSFHDPTRLFAGD